MNALRCSTRFSRFLPALLLLLILSSGCQRSGNSPREENGSATAAAHVPTVFDVIERPGMSPSFSWKDPSGATTTFDSYRGKVTIVNFWATWCGPCRKELPDLVAVSNELADEDVRVIGISTDRGGSAEEDVRKFIDEYKIPYPVVISTSDVEEAFGNVTALPTTFIVAKDGTIASTIVGMRDKKFFLDAIRRVAS